MPFVDHFSVRPRPPTIQDIWGIFFSSQIDARHAGHSAQYFILYNRKSNLILRYLCVICLIHLNTELWNHMSQWLQLKFGHSEKATQIWNNHKIGLFLSFFDRYVPLWNFGCILIRSDFYADLEWGKSMILSVTKNIDQTLCVWYLKNMPCRLKKGQ